MGMIAGLEVGLPNGIGDVDGEWMTAVLRTSGAIGPDSTITSVVNEPYIAGGLLSLLFRSALESDDPEAPRTVIVKFPSDIPAQRAMADAFGVYHREVVFYRDIAPRSDIAMPVVHAAMTAPDRSNSCIVMEDLAHLRQPSRADGVTWDEAVAGIRALARFHAGWHNSPELPDLMDPFISIGAPSQRAGLQSIAVNGWPGAKHHEPDVLSPDVIALGDMWVDRLDAMLDHMCTNPTLCHQDWRGDNMFLGNDGEIVMIDPQIAGVANGAYDIGYFISQSMERGVSAGRERELIQHYVDVMAERGHQVDPDRVYFDTRVAVGLCLMYGFSSYAQYDQLDDQGKEMTRKLLRRGAESIDDLDSLGAVLELPRPD
jgi:Phosphotransferase enzyme family